MDAPIPALIAGINKAIPTSATGLAAELRGQTIAVNEGRNPETFLIADAVVRSAGNIPVQIIKHETQYSEVPSTGPPWSRCGPTAGASGSRSPTAAASAPLPEAATTFTSTAPTSPSRPSSASLRRLRPTSGHRGRTATRGG
ncbi:hypothetical protein [Streptomyces sp. NPDC053720]|uniref:hypothetical protein n=1 Tax=Streptomyces sp. NPDC053720 TaxID=3154855 RepID=UPI00341ABE50